MWGEAACALSASGLSHFSISTKVSAPNFACMPPAPSASIAGPYSMQPASARTAGTLARNAARICSRMPGLAVMIATTWIMALPFGCLRFGYCSLGDLLGDAFENAVLAARRQRPDLGRPVAKAAGLFPGGGL